MQQRSFSLFGLTSLWALPLVVCFCPQSFAKIEVSVTQGPAQEKDSATVKVISQVDGEVRFICVGRGYLKTATLVKGASEVFRPPSPGVYQYRIQAGGDRERGALTLEDGERAEVVLTGSYGPLISPKIEKTSEDLEYHPPAGAISLPNPFGPAFEKLAIEEKIRLVQESPNSKQLTAPERVQLLGFLYNEKGVQEAEKKNFVGAEEALRKAQQMLPSETTVRQNLAFAVAGNGNQQRLSGNYSLSEKKLKEAQVLVSGTPDENLAAQIRLAMAALFVDQAMAMPGSEQKRKSALFEKALENDPGHPVALFQLGQAAYQDYDLETALDLFQRAYEAAQEPELAALIEKVQLEIQEAGDFVTQDRGVFKISFEGSETKHVAKETRRLLAEAQREMAGKFSLRPTGTIPVVIYSAGQFKQILGLHSWAGGAYDGKIRLPIADWTEEDLASGRDMLRQLVFHEYTHALIHNRTAPAKIPVWLHEGLAQNAAGQNPDTPILRNQVFDSLRSGRLPMPSGLSGEFAGIGDPALAAQLYLESFLFVSYLIEEEGGWSRIRSLLAAVRDGQSVSEAFEKAYKKSLEELEQRWLDRE